MNEDNDMNRREFAKGLLAFAGAVALGGVGMAEEGTKKMNKKCTRENVQMSNKHKKKYSTSPELRYMQI